VELKSAVSCTRPCVGRVGRGGRGGGEEAMSAWLGLACVSEESSPRPAFGCAALLCLKLQCVVCSKGERRVQAGGSSPRRINHHLPLPLDSQFREAHRILSADSFKPPPIVLFARAVFPDRRRVGASRRGRSNAGGGGVLMFRPGRERGGAGRPVEMGLGGGGWGRRPAIARDPDCETWYGCHHHVVWVPSF